jgi:hypothetical protein
MDQEVTGWTKPLAGQNLWLNKPLAGQNLWLDKTTGRTQSVDAHRVAFGLKKGVPVKTSLPTTNTRYLKVLPTTVNDQDGAKLVIGTRSFNALATSSLGIDPNMHSRSTPSIGSTTCSFMLISPEDTKATKIYLDDISVKKALSLLSRDDAVNCIEPSDILYQIRQVRSKFHRKSTYFLCRAAACLTSNHDNRPYTIFTLCDYDSGDYSDAKIGSKLFRTIALQVVRNEETELKKSGKKASNKLQARRKSERLLW